MTVYVAAANSATTSDLDPSVVAATTRFLFSPAEEREPAVCRADVCAADTADDPPWNAAKCRYFPDVAVQPSWCGW